MANNFCMEKQFCKNFGFLGSSDVVNLVKSKALIGRSWSPFHAALSQPKPRDHRHGASASRGMPVYSPDFVLLLFLCGMHHLGCVAPNSDISLQSGRFWATVIASSRERLLDLRSWWIVFIYVVRGRPGGLFQFSEGEAVMICKSGTISHSHHVP